MIVNLAQWKQGARECRPRHYLFFYTLWLSRKSPKGKASCRVRKASKIMPLTLALGASISRPLSSTFFFLFTYVDERERLRNHGAELTRSRHIALYVINADLTAYTTFLLLFPRLLFSLSPFHVFVVEARWCLSMIGFWYPAEQEEEEEKKVSPYVRPAVNRI